MLWTPCVTEQLQADCSLLLIRNCSLRMAASREPSSVGSPHSYRLWEACDPAFQSVAGEGRPPAPGEAGGLSPCSDTSAELFSMLAASDSAAAFATCTSVPRRT